jgi:hypothetical protein
MRWHGLVGIALALIAATKCIGAEWSILFAFGLLVFIAVANLLGEEKVGCIELPRVTLVEWCIVAVILLSLLGLLTPATITR